MSFRRENGRGHLDLSEEDFERVVYALGIATANARHAVAKSFLVNRVNEGNPRWTPHEIDDDAPVALNPAGICRTHVPGDCDGTGPSCCR